MAATPSVSSSATQDPAPPPSRRRAAMLVPILAVAVAQVALVFPSPTSGLIQSQFHATATELSWVSAIFFLPTSVLELTFGVAGDLFGRKRLLALGCFVMAVGDLVGAAAPNIGVLIAGQALAGVGAAAIFPTSLSMLVSLSADGKSRAYAFAQWTMGIAAGSSSGPVIAGAIGLSGSVRPAFAVVAAIGVVTGIITVLLAADSRSPQGRRLDLPGQAAIAIALTAILFAIIQGTTGPKPPPAALIALVAGIVFLVVFVIIEKRTAVPMLDLSVFRVPAFTGAALVAIVSMCGFLGGMYSVSMRVAVIQGQNSLITGLTTLIVNIIPFLLWPFAGRILYRVPARWLMSIGLVCLAAGQAWLSQVPVADTSLLSIAGPLLLFGIGFTSVVSTMSAATVNSVPARLVGVASGATNLVRDFGQAIGVAIIGAVAMAGATAQLPGLLAKAGLDPKSLAITTGISKAGGPIAVAHANIGPASAKTIPLARQALWHGFSTGLVVCAVLSVIALVIALITMRPASAAEPAQG